MATFRRLIDPGGLSAHLDRLRSTLEALRERLRAAVAGAVGDSVAGLVRDAIQAVLAGTMPVEHDRTFANDRHVQRTPSWRSGEASIWDEPSDDTDWRDDD